MRQKYCTKCGTQLVKKIVRADKIEYFFFCGGYHPFSRFNPRTGKEQFAKYWKCPNGKWYNNHTSLEREAKVI